MSQTPPSPAQKAPVIQDRALAYLVAMHGQPMRLSYNAMFDAPTRDVQKNLFDKLSLCAILPNFENKPEAYIPMNEFSLEDTRTMMWLLETRGIQSEFTWLPSANGPSLHLSIRDERNKSFQTLGKMSPVAAIAEHKARLQAQNTLNEFIKSAGAPDAAKPDIHYPACVPNISIIETQKGLYVSIKDMNQNERSELQLRMKSHLVTYKYYNSPSEGEVYVAPYEDWSALQQVQSEIEIENINGADKRQILSDANNPQHPEFHLQRARKNMEAQLGNLHYHAPKNE